MSFQNGKPRNLVRLVRVLDLLANTERPITLREASSQLGINKPSLLRLLGFMREEGLAAQSEGPEGYSLGPRVLPWASSYLRNVNLLAISQDRIRKLRDQCNETVVLSIVESLSRIVLAVEHPSREVRTHINVGQTIPLPYGAGGKAVSAFLGAKLLAELLSRPIEPLTRTTVRSPRGLRAEIGKIRKCFLAVSKGERAEETWALASPIFNHSNEVAGSVAIVCPRYRYRTAARYGKNLLRLAGDLSSELGSSVKFPGRG